jgi:phosphogluconate dehydratase
MSGASGKVPAAIHLTPEAADGGPIARLKTGDVIRLDAERGVLEVMIERAELLARPAAADPKAGETGYGRELFAPMRAMAQPAELGGGVFFGA